MKTSSKDDEIENCKFSLNTCESNPTFVDVHEQPTSGAQQEYELEKENCSNKISSGKSLKTSSFYNYSTPCPFTFLTAVKCKFPTDKSNASLNRTGKPNKVDQVCDSSMDPVKPLNIPNLHIFPKACHVSQKLESSNEKSLASKQSCSSSKTKSDNTNRVSTHSESPPSTVNITLRSKNIELVKVPNIVPANQKIIVPNNEKERDHSRNKENRFIGKIEKEDGKGVQNRNDIQSSVKCSRHLQKHDSSQDILDRVTNKTIENDNILNRHCKDNDNTIKKSAKTRKEKPRNPRNFSARSHREMSNRSDTLTEKVKVKKDRETTNSTTENSKCKDNNQASLHPNLKSTLLEPQNNSNSAESTGMTSQDYSEHLSDQESTQLDSTQDSTMADAKKYQKLDLTAPLPTLCTTAEESFNNLHIQQNNVEYSTNVLSPNISNHSSNDSIIETKLSQDSLSEKLMDPMRISFREDSYSNQPEFSNLVTPNVNLVIRSRRRKQVIQRNMSSNDDCKDSKVEATTGSNPSDQLLFAHKLTHSIDESSAHDKPSPNRQKTSDTSTKSKSTDTNEKEILNHSAKGSVDKSSYIADNVQTETFSCHYRDNTSLVFSKECTDSKETLYNSLNLGGGYENATRLDDISLSKKVRTMSEISLHETTSSIRTESGTEISISLRDVTCSFNKNLDLEMAQLIDDERQRYNKIEMLFKSQEKSLNDRTRKLVKLEEQKKVLRDTGQDSRISSVKKKQRALLLKLQQEKEEMNRLKELHKIASQERKLMLQKQRDMFNPDMSTKNILHKLKRSADSQSPRRLSGPMKGYDIRSNSSISSLIDSDKSQLDRSKFDCSMNMTDVMLQKGNKNNIKMGINRFPNKVSRTAESHDASFSKIETGRSFEETRMSQMKCDSRSRKFDERMPKSDMKYQLYDLESVLENGAIELLKDDNHVSLSRNNDPNFIFENVRTNSNALIEEFTEIWKSHFSQSKNKVDKPADAAKAQYVTTFVEKLDDESLSGKLQSNANVDDGKSTKRKGLKLHKSKTLPTNSSNTSDLRYIKKTFCHKSKSSEALDKKSYDEYLSSPKQISVQELIKHSDLLKERNEELLKDISAERNNFAKQSSEILSSAREEQDRKKQEEEVKEEEEEDDIIEKSDNVSVQSHVSLAISHQSSNESDKSYLKSVVIRSQQDYQPHSSFQTSRKLEQILKAREATLISRRNCVEEWISWHARLRDEEERVSRMEKAAYKLVSATARTLSLNDTTISSDNSSDVEGRIELLTKKLSDRRFEMTRLKKEARKQAKRRLRALEANLMTQIKRYDNTINEMRNKLETKKGPNRQSTKLEIESRSVDDYKVPDLPIKNIQEIYKRSGLLRSRSDSDFAPIIENNGARYKPTTSKVENPHAEKIRVKNSANLSTEEYCKSSVTRTSDLHKSQSPTEISKRELEDIDGKNSNLSQNSHTSEGTLTKVGSIDLENVASSISSTEEKLKHDSEITSQSIISKKLSHIQLNNRELNDDIHNLENDLRELSEMMLNFSKKSSDQNSISMDSTRKTSKAIDEPLSEKLPKILDESKHDIEGDTIVTDLQMRVEETLSNGIPDTDSISESIEELYSEIKSKDDRVEQHSPVPGSSEKSIETEEPFRMSKSLQTINEGDYKTDTCSILEIISPTVEKAEEKRSHELDHQAETSIKLLSNDSDSHLVINNDDKKTSARSTDTSFHNQSDPTDNYHEGSVVHTATNESDNQDGSKYELDVSLTPKKMQNVAHAKESRIEALPTVAESTGLHSFHYKLDENEKESFERDTQNIYVAEDHERNSISDVEDSTIFTPECESTNLLETFVLKLDNSSDIGMGICSEEFNDILEIIERETKNDDKLESAFQEKDSPVDKEKVDDYNDGTHHRRSHKENTTSQEPTRITTVENHSENIAEGTKNDANSLGVGYDVLNVEDRAGNTFIPLNSFMKLNETFEQAKVLRADGDSSDGEQMNNLIEVVENKLDMLQQSDVPKENKILADKPKTHVTVFLDKTLQVIRDPEYEDISEESLEVSDIFNSTNPAFHKHSKKSTAVPEKYIIKSESNEVLRILDEISNKSNKFDHDHQEMQNNRSESPMDTNLINESISNENVSPSSIESSRSKLEGSSEEISEEFSGDLKHEVAPNKSNIVEEDAKQNVNVDSEKLTGLDNEPKRDVNLDVKKDSCLDLDIFNENPLDNNSLLPDAKTRDATAEFRTTPMGVSSEKDIETMIKKLKASLEQPGIEVAELEAKLLEIENLQIELAIKKLEAEEVSYYVREIPNKPPPPYTPPGSVRQPGSNGVSSSFSIIPTNIEELSIFTEKATAIIHVKKKSGDDVQFLEAPDEILKDVTDSSTDAVKKNRLIYNTFLFDLCKELVVDIYKVEEENPGPSWTKPKVKTKRVIKIPKSINELNEYVSKEVATLFGFKTKLQRENMVMRWSRKRRDRVDELLAKEAQAEEKEWTKFHHDELAVKNELTVTIMNNLLTETTSCIKNAYAKKRKLNVI